MHTLLVSKSGWHHLLTCITIVALFLSGCASGPPQLPPPPTVELSSQKGDRGPPRLPPGPSEKLRSQLGKIRISDRRVQPEVEFSKPVTRAEGAAKGTGMGFVGGFAVLGGGYPFALLYPIWAPVALIGGTVKGVQASQSEAKVKEFEKTFKATIEELNVPESLRQGVADRIRFLEVSEVTGPYDQAASIIMEIVVTKIILYHVDWFAPYKLAINGSTRLIRATDNMELYRHLFVTTGQEFPFDEWLAEDAAKLRQEVERNCHELAEQIVEEIFFAVRLKEKKEKFNEPVEVDP